MDVQVVILFVVLVVIISYGLYRTQSDDDNDVKTDRPIWFPHDSEDSHESNDSNDSLCIRLKNEDHCVVGSFGGNMDVWGTRGQYSATGTVPFVDNDCSNDDVCVNPHAAVASANSSLMNRFTSIYVQPEHQAGADILWQSQWNSNSVAGRDWDPTMGQVFSGNYDRAWVSAPGVNELWGWIDMGSKYVVGKVRIWQVQDTAKHIKSFVVHMTDTRPTGPDYEDLSRTDVHAGGDFQGLIYRDFMFRDNPIYVGTHTRYYNDGVGGGTVLGSDDADTFGGASDSTNDADKSWGSGYHDIEFSTNVSGRYLFFKAWGEECQTEECSSQVVGLLELEFFGWHLGHCEDCTPSVEGVQELVRCNQLDPSRWTYDSANKFLRSYDDSSSCLHASTYVKAHAGTWNRVGEGWFFEEPGEEYTRENTETMQKVRKLPCESGDVTEPETMPPGTDLEGWKQYYENMNQREKNRWEWDEVTENGKKVYRSVRFPNSYIYKKDYERQLPPWSPTGTGSVHHWINHSVDGHAKERPYQQIDAKNLTLQRRFDAGNDANLVYSERC